MTLDNIIVVLFVLIAVATVIGIRIHTRRKEDKQSSTDI
jgi:hypothetical protein